MRWLSALILTLGVTAAVPTQLDETASLASLQTALDDVVDRTGWSADRWSILAVSLDRGDTLYAQTSDRPLVPASTLKLMTTAAAMRYLGPDYRYPTYLLTDGTVKDSVLEGNVYLYGTGDPTLGKRFAPRATSVFYAFADTLAAMGVREIRGAIIGDGSYFEGPSTGPGWEADYMNAWYAPASGALSVHENLVRLNVGPGTAPGAPPVIEYVPGGAGIAVDNTATTGGGGRLIVQRLEYDGPIVIRGGVSGTVSRAVPVSDPAQYAAALFRDVLVEKGITHTGRVTSIEKPAASPVTGRKAFAPAFDGKPVPRVVAVHRSGPLREMLETINHVSHNFYAEQVVRTVGRVAGGEGSLRGGSRAVKRLLAEAGADTAGMAIVDGCGLSPRNRVNARSFVALLAYMARSPLAEEFKATLPVAGQWHRFRRMGGTPAAGNLRAKTGTIDHVSALAGYVTAANGERIAFSIISNDVPSTAQAKYIENVIGARLAAFDRGGGVLAAVETAPAAAPASRGR